MAYSQGGLIAAADYNSFVGTSPSSTANQINTVWAVGNGNAGYGQSSIAQVSQSGTVTATQWATLINTLNSILTHQSGAGSGISATTAGTTINYLSTLQTNVNTAYTNRTNASTQGTTTTGTNFAAAFTDANGNGPFTHTITRTVTFASADQARYFFNCGGQLNFVVSSVTNGDGTARSGDIVTMVGTNFGGFSAFKQGSGGGRTGTGGTLNTNATNIGYYQLTNVAQTLVSVNSTTSGYTSDNCTLTANYSGVLGSNGDKSPQITFVLTFTSAARNNPTLGTQFNDSLNVTVNHRIDVVYPETTNITNTWGTATVA